MNQINFKENPQNLKFKYQLTNNRTDSGLLDNFDVFIGLKDKIEYIPVKKYMDIYKELGK